MATKQIKYLNREFDSLKTDLIQFAKTYFPNTYNDFGPSSIGMMFIQMSAYIGDVLSYYVDNNIQQMFLQYANNQSSIMRIAQMFGYKPSINSAANVILKVSVTVPIVGGNVQTQYIPIILPNTVVNNTINSDIKFIIQQPITFYSDTDPSITGTEGIGDYYTFSKYVSAISAKVQSIDIQSPINITQY